METPRLTSLHIQNFKSLKDIKLENLPPLVVLIGENGSGKSSVLEGVNNLFIREVGLFGDDPQTQNSKLTIQSHSNKDEIDEIIVGRLTGFVKNPISLREMLNNLKNYISFSKINPLTIPANSEANGSTHISTTGDNLPSVCYYLQEKHPVVWEDINSTLRQFVPGLNQVFVIAIPNSRVVYLHFKNEKNESVFLPREMSDGTLLMLAHLVLLRHPEPHPLLCIDEPEHHLYPKFLPILAEEIEAYAERAGTVFMATHSPHLLNALPFESVYFCKKNTDNVTEIHRLSDNEHLRNLYEAGDLAGNMLRHGIIDIEYQG